MRATRLVNGSLTRLVNGSSKDLYCRTQLAFLRLLCLNAGWRFEASVLERERVIGAMIESFDGKLEALTELIRDIASPKP